MRVVALFLIPFTALLHTAVAQKAATSKKKPTVYNEIIKENDAADKAVEAAYSAEFDIIEVRHNKAYTAATETTSAVPPSLRSQARQSMPGDIEVAFIVTADGRVIEPFILKSTDKRLDVAVLNAIRQWHFAPARLNGSAVSSIHAVQVTFGASRARYPTAFAIYAPKPDYPLEARIHHWTGKGLIVLDVDQQTGAVTAARMVTSTGHAILDQAAISTFSRWRFKPGVKKEVKVPINFTMSY
jgi:TonB family protein